jgi:hypothetical protein
MDQVEMEQLWSEHLDGEFAAKDVEATLETMTRDPHAARPEAATPCNRPRFATLDFRLYVCPPSSGLR